MTVPHYDHEQQAIEAAVLAWVEAATCIRDGSRGQGPFEGECADDILARYGITFDADPSRYCRVETEVRERALKVIGHKRRGGRPCAIARRVA